MIAELPPSAAAGVIWPCGPECRHARTLAGTYGEWLWCEHPETGGCIVRAGRECMNYNPDPKPPPALSPRLALH
jgi:hypothetical protein